MIFALIKGAWEVLIIGMILGAGVPSIFALGLRAMSYGAVRGQDTANHRPNMFARVVAICCFAIVIAAILIGITIIVSDGLGMKLNFGWPLLVSK